MSIQFNSASGVTGQTFAWVVADNASDATKDNAVPLLVVEGPLTVSGQGMFAGLAAVTAAVRGTLNVEGQSTMAGVTALSASIHGSLGVAGPSSLSNVTAQAATINGTLNVAGQSTLAGVTAQSTFVNGTLGVTGQLTARGIVDIEGPGQGTPFNVLTVNTLSFGTGRNSMQSYFVIARDIGAAPPAGRIKFSVRGDGQLFVDGDGKFNGTLSAPHKNFLIDHPLDPKGKQLVHGCLEGPECGVYYRGEGRLVRGTAVVELPSYFEALARKQGRTVQVTPLFERDEPVSTLAVSAVAGGRFEVRAVDERNPSQSFFWEVKAARADLAPLETEIAKGSALAADEDAR